MQATPQIPAPGLMLRATASEKLALAELLARVQLCVLGAGWIVPNSHVEGASITGDYCYYTQCLIYKAESHVSQITVP